MTAEQRRSAENGIWLCQTHARLIDSDEAGYPAQALREMKVQHEARISAEMRGERPPTDSSVLMLDLIGIGPDIVATGRLMEGSSSHWSVELHDFIRGTQPALLGYLEHFEQHHDYDRFVLVNAHGDGRVLRAGARWTQGPGFIRLDLPIEPRFPRKRAQELAPTLAIDDEGDIDIARGMVSGIDALHQHLLLSFGHQRGESQFSPLFGSRTAEYHGLYGKTAWFERLLKLEAIRMAAIPYFDEPSESTYTPFQCVDQVREIRVVGPGSRQGSLDARLVLDVRGVGTYEDRIPVFIADPAAATVRA